ncbi:MAG: DUF4367 domain-containing protein [Clostridia bacterium]|nr:DUF4367 domain-containing protein [Clostridia bacterium]
MISREDVFVAFREVASSDFVSVPSEAEIEYEFSDRFYIKMNKLIRDVEYNNKHLVSKGKRNVIAFVAAVIILLTGLMSVSAVRESLLEFFVNIQKTFAEFTFGGETTKQIDYVYSFLELPEGFVLTNEEVDLDMSVYRRYYNTDTEESIVLMQNTTDGMHMSVDRENGAYEKILLEDTEIYLYENNLQNSIFAQWIQDGYYMLLDYQGKESQEWFLNLIKTIS